MTIDPAPSVSKQAVSVWTEVCTCTRVAGGVGEENETSIEPEDGVGKAKEYTFVGREGLVTDVVPFFVAVLLFAIARPSRKARRSSYRRCETLPAQSALEY